MQAFQAQQGELPAQAEHDLNVFVDAYAGPENLLDATRLAAEMLPDYRLAIEREMLQLVDFKLVDSAATMHIVPDYIANALPTGGPAAWIAPAAPRPPNVPVLDLDAFLEGVDEPVQLLPDGAALNFDLALGPAATADLAGPLTMLPRPYGLRSSLQQWLDRIQLQEVPSYVASLNGNLERRFSELRSLSRHAFDGQVYMVYGASGAATAPRHSRPESFNDIARQHIGCPDRILRDLQFPAPAFWPMADSGATVNVEWDTELTANPRAQSHALRGFQGMASFAIGEAFLDILVLAHVQNEG
jgi:hypothetical protein